MKTDCNGNQRHEPGANPLLSTHGYVFDTIFSLNFDGLKTFEDGKVGRCIWSGIIRTQAIIHTARSVEPRTKNGHVLLTQEQISLFVFYFSSISLLFFLSSSLDTGSLLATG